MTDKRKKLIRDLSKKSGMSYQAASNTLRPRQAAQTASEPAPIASLIDAHAERRRTYRGDCLAAWRGLVTQLLPTGSRIEWTSARDIATVLAQVAAQAPQNHCFYPRSGGLDLSGARLSSTEPGCVDLTLQGTRILVRPESLELQRAANDPLCEWAYFRLQCAPLAPSGVYDLDDDADREELLELSPGHYVDRIHWDEGYVYDEDGDRVDLPDDASTLSRVFRGAFAIFPKASTYNANPATYDGRHSRMSAGEFAAHIQAAVDYLHKRGSYGLDPRA